VRTGRITAEEALNSRDPAKIIKALQSSLKDCNALIDALKLHTMPGREMKLLADTQPTLKALIDAGTRVRMWLSQWSVLGE
jgi:hypothetical protein